MLGVPTSVTEVERDEYWWEKIPKAAQVEFPHPNSHCLGQPISELGRLEWMKDWDEAKPPKSLFGTLGKSLETLKEDFN